MIKVSVMYPNSAGSTFDMAYYLNSHMPLVALKLGPALRGAAVDQGLGGGQPGSPPPFLAIGHLLFDTLESFQKGFAEHGKTFMADIPHYTNVQPTILISEVKL